MKFRIRNLMIIFLLMLILVPITLLSIFSYHNAREILITEMKHSSLQTIEDANRYFISNYILQIEHALNIFSSNPKTITVFDNYGDRQDLVEEWESYRRFNNNIFFIYIGTEEGQIFSSPPWEQLPDYDPRVRPWYEEAMANQGKISWSRPYEELISHRKVVTAATTLEKDGEVLGVLGIDTSIDTLSALVKNLNLGNDAYAILLDNRGHVVAHPDLDMIGENLSSSSWYIDITTDEKGSLLYMLNSQPTFISYTTIPNTDWKLIGFLPRAALEKNISPIRNNALTLAIIFSFLALGSSILISNNITKLIKGFIKAMDQLEMGQYSVSLSYPFTLETSRLAEKFNRMTTKLKNLINELQATEKELEKQTTFFQQLFINSPEAIAIMDKDSRIIRVNRYFEEFFQYSSQEIVGKNLDDLIIPDNLQNEAIGLTSHTLENNNVELETVRKRKDGSFVDVLILGYPVISSDNQLMGIYGIYRDITNRKRSEKHLRYLSLHDALTGLYNRASFEDKLISLKKENLNNIGIILCDVDGLKLINDTLGHTQGDMLLIEATKVLNMAVPEKATMFRIGGDEFAVLVTDTSLQELEAISENIRRITEEHNIIQNKEFSLSLSLGYALKDATTNIDEVFKTADANMYKEKMQQSLSARSAIVKTLTKALEARDFITEGHGERLQHYVEQMGLKLNLPKNQITDLKLFAHFHDIGKVGISDQILFKPGPLSAEEYKEMQRHSEIGYRIALSAPDLNHIADWILKHHEWWNGKGYPLGLVGEDIPLECRILAIADAFDAMTSDRPYRKALPKSEALDEIKRSAGIKFDPELVKIFIDLYFPNTN